GDPVLRRLAGAGSGLGRAPLVPREAGRDPVLLHLGALDLPAPPLRPAHELRLEGAAAGVDRERAHRLAVALRAGIALMPILFLGFAALLVITALLVVLHRNPVTSALFLVLAFCSLAGIYLLLKAEFLGMVQVVVYAGAIMVLFLFVIMYLNLQHDVESGVQIAVRRGLGWLAGAALLLTGAALLRRGMSPGPANEVLAGAEQGNVAGIGRA